MTQEQTAITLPGGQYYYGTGRRKSAVARVFLKPGKGAFVVNGKPVDEFFGLPFEAAELMGNFDVYAKVAGGGVSAWADAIAHGIARALLSYEEKLRPALRKAGLLTRDPRIKERKKPGLKRARKAPQYTKR